MFPTEGHEPFECLYCRAVVEVRIIEEPDKATYPAIEFCPCCGMSLVDLSVPPSKPSYDSGLVKTPDSHPPVGGD